MLAEPMLVAPLARALLTEPLVLPLLAQPFLTTMLLPILAATPIVVVVTPIMCRSDVGEGQSADGGDRRETGFTQSRADHVYLLRRAPPAVKVVTKRGVAAA